LLALAVTASLPASGQTLKAVKDRGEVVCGVNPGLPGFAARNAANQWAGFDVDLCRALAAAIFNDASKVRFEPLSNEARLSALSSGQVDVLSRNTTWTMSRETAFKLNFAAVTYYDGQGFLLRRALRIESALELDGRAICTLAGTTTELNLSDYFRANNMKLVLRTLSTAEQVLKEYDSGRCDVLTSDVSQLHAERLMLSQPDDHMILPDIISKEPLGPVVRQGDDQWFKIVQWTHFAQINAEELGISSKTVDQSLQSAKPDVRRLVGSEGNFGAEMGLTNDWAARIIRLVGNYGESFERNIGTGSPLGIPRGVNQLWAAGGIQYAPPIR
jgi:general L-amino acid transport system substrate-binding protein